MSGHTHNPAGGRPHFVTEHRITLPSDAANDGVLWAVPLRERRFYEVDPRGTVTSRKDASRLV